MFPAWVALSVLSRRDPAALASQRYWRWNAWALVAIGALQFVATMTALTLQATQGGAGHDRQGRHNVHSQPGGGERGMTLLAFLF